MKATRVEPAGPTDGEKRDVAMTAPSPETGQALPPSPAPRQDEVISADSLRVAELLARAQGGDAAAVLAEVEAELRSQTGDLADGAPGLHFARTVALLRLHPERGHGAASDLFVAAAVRDQSGWLPSAYADRASAPYRRGGADWAAIDSEAALRDLAAGEAALDVGTLDDVQRCNAHAGLGIAYEMLRLYELAAPHYEAAHETSLKVPAGRANPVFWSLNLAGLHMTWALELYRVSAGPEADIHVAAGARFAAQALDEAPTGTSVFRHMAHLFAACARANGSDTDGVAKDLRRLIDTAKQWEAVEVALLAESFYAVALAKEGDRTEAINHLDRVCAEAAGQVDAMSEAAVTHTRAILLASQGDPHALAALAYGDVLARALWQERLRTVNAARTMRELERLRVEHEDVARSATTDPLTGVANRRALDDLLAALPADGAVPVAVLVVDVDSFKQSNDTYGHDAGDAALQAIAAALSKGLRTGDTVARFGGDEFVVILPGADATVAAAVADRLVRAVDDSPDCPTTVSVGVAVRPAAEVTDGLRVADTNMYTAKRTGGGRWHLADPVVTRAGH